jgi:hypothetical protein
MKQQKKQPTLTSIAVPRATRDRVRDYCRQRGIKMGFAVEQWIEESIDHAECLEEQREEVRA